MTREIKIRYTYKRKDGGKIWQEIVPIECLEGKGDKPFAVDVNNHYWDIIARDLYTGQNDKNENEIYEGDIREGRYFCGTDPRELITRQVMKWDENNACFYWELIFGGEMPDFIGTKIIGNVHSNPELLVKEVSN